MQTQLGLSGQSRKGLTSSLIAFPSKASAYRNFVTCVDFGGVTPTAKSHKMHQRSLLFIFYGTVLTLVV